MNEARIWFKLRELRGREFIEVSVLFSPDDGSELAAISGPTLRCEPDSARDPLDPLYHSAWIRGDEVHGDGLVNDKGPMAAFLVAAKAIKQAGYPMKLEWFAPRPS